MRFFLTHNTTASLRIGAGAIRFGQDVDVVGGNHFVTPAGHHLAVGLQQLGLVMMNRRQIKKVCSVVNCTEQAFLASAAHENNEALWNFGPGRAAKQKVDKQKRQKTTIYNIPVDIL